MFAQIQALNLSNTFSKIMNLGKQFFFFFFKLLGHCMKASGKFFLSFEHSSNTTNELSVRLVFFFYLLNTHTHTHI